VGRVRRTSVPSPYSCPLGTKPGKGERVEFVPWFGCSHPSQMFPTPAQACPTEGSSSLLPARPVRCSMLCFLPPRPGPGSGFLAPPRPDSASRSPWLLPPGDLGAATQDGAAQISRLPAASAVRSARARAHTPGRAEAQPPAEEPRALRPAHTRAHAPRPPASCRQAVTLAA
jgi:hypothetical protein